MGGCVYPCVCVYICVLVLCAGVHLHGTGVHLPPYALNMFVPLVDLTPENGPTEVALFPPTRSQSPPFRNVFLLVVHSRFSHVGFPVG